MEITRRVKRELGKLLKLFWSKRSAVPYLTLPKAVKPMTARGWWVGVGAEGCVGMHLRRRSTEAS